MKCIATADSRAPPERAVGWGSHLSTIQTYILNQYKIKILLRRESWKTIVVAFQYHCAVVWYAKETLKTEAWSALYL